MYKCLKSCHFHEFVCEKAVIRWERSFGGSGHSVGAVIRWERSFGGSGHSVVISVTLRLPEALCPKKDGQWKDRLLDGDGSRGI
jgi:hypothetical protein